MTPFARVNFEPDPRPLDPDRAPGLDEIDDPDFEVKPYADTSRASEPPPAYQDLIEIPEHYHLWHSQSDDNVYLTVPLDPVDLVLADIGPDVGTWLRIRAFSAFDWFIILESDEMRLETQKKVNDIVNDWRERFGAP